MTTKELSDKESTIYRQVFSLPGTMDEKTQALKDTGIFDQYKEIHEDYLTLVKTTKDENERNEGLKRILFLNWYHMMEPSCFTGMWELNGDTIHESYLILNNDIKDNKIDEELKWMISHYYSSGEWTILSFSEESMPELTTYLRTVDITKNHMPNKDILNKTMAHRGQMGEYFTSE